MLTICLALSWFLAYGGYFAMQTSPNFCDSQIADVPRKSSIYLVTCVELLGSIASTMLIDRIGRRTLFIISCTGGLLSAVTMCVYSWLHNNDMLLYCQSLVIFVSVTVFMFSLAVGLTSSTMLNVAEQFDLQVHHYTASVIATPQGYFKYSAMMLFFVVRYYFGLHWSFMMSALSIIGAMMVVMCLLPEKNGTDLFVGMGSRWKTRIPGNVRNGK